MSRFLENGVQRLLENGQPRTLERADTVATVTTDWSSWNGVAIATVFTPLKTGTAAAVWTEVTASAGKRIPKSAAAVTWGEALTAAGKRVPKGTPAVVWTETITAAGKRAPKGSAPVTWTETITAAGKRAPKSTSAVTWTETLTSTGKQTPKASTTTTWTEVLTAAGKRVPKATTATTWTETLTSRGIWYATINTDWGGWAATALAARGLYATISTNWSGAKPFAPDDLTGLKLWLDPVKLGLTDGASVSSWAGGVPPTGYEAGPYGKYVTNGLNGQPLVRFVPGSGLRWMNTGITTSWTVVYIGRIIGPAVGRIVTAVYPPSNLLIGYWNGEEDVFYHEGFTEPNTMTPWTGQWRIYSADGLPSPLTRCYRNDDIGISTLLGTTTTGTGWQNMFALNGYQSDGVAETADCEVAEVVMYDRRLTGLERVNVENYLRTKYLIPGGATIGPEWPATGVVAHPALTTTNWGTWTATAEGLVIAEEIFATVTTNWSSWTATVIGGVSHQGFIATAWSTWSAVADPRPIQKNATVVSDWGTWTATALAPFIQHSAVIVTSWSSWDATAIGIPVRAATIATNWSGWLATVDAVVERAAIIDTGTGSYLDASIGTATTADPGPLPLQCVFVYNALGPTTGVGTLAGQYEVDPQRAWLVRRTQTNGRFTVNLTSAGTAATSVSMTSISVPPTILPTGAPERLAIAVDHTVASARAWRISPSDGSWVADASAGTMAPIIAYDATGVIRIGAYSGTQVAQWFGRIFSVELRTGLDPTAGTVVWRFDAAEYTGTGTSFTDARGRVWNLTTAKALVASSSWNSWNAVATHVVGRPAVIDTNWGGWTATADTVPDHPATGIGVWGATSLTAVAGVTRIATVATNWGSWNATAIGTPTGVGQAVINMDWSSWSATAIALRASFMSIATAWPTWNAVAIATPTRFATITTSWGTWTATTDAQPIQRNATVTTSWGTWDATAVHLVSHFATITQGPGNWVATAIGQVGNGKIATIDTAWGTWDAAAIAARGTNATVVTNWGTWTATADGHAVHETLATIVTNWSSWAATSIALPIHPATTTTDWSSWTATATAQPLTHLSTIATSWGNWSALAVYLVQHIALVDSLWGTGWYAVAMATIQRNASISSIYTATLVAASEVSHPALAVGYWGGWSALSDGQVSVHGVVINEADVLYLGDEAVDRVYLDGHIVWELV